LVFGPRGGEVITAQKAEFQEGCRHPGADEVAAAVHRTGAAVPIAVKTGFGLIAAAFQRVSQYIQWLFHDVQIILRKYSRKNTIFIDKLKITSKIRLL
jgi:hypothetical protein